MRIWIYKTDKALNQEESSTLKHRKFMEYISLQHQQIKANISVIIKAKLITPLSQFNWNQKK